ncbi:MAG: hypothetical protein NC935_01880 [Candidatus Omnitrophica bacterium]|nr:hypothetical protein [Candidatus Omnitrophota bacterium]
MKNLIFNKHFISCILLIIVSALVFSNSLHSNFFIWDDEDLIVRNEYFHLC